MDSPGCSHGRPPGTVPKVSPPIPLRNRSALLTADRARPFTAHTIPGGLSRCVLDPGSARQREDSLGISLSVRIMSTGVLVFTQTSVSLKNFAGTFSIASPTVFTGSRLPFLVVFQS